MRFGKSRGTVAVDLGSGDKDPAHAVMLGIGHALAASPQPHPGELAIRADD